MKTKEKEHKRFHCPSGSIYENKFAVSIDNNGHKTLRKTGEKVNVYELIQAHRDSVDIEKLIERSKIEDDPSILDRREALTGDVTKMPKSMLEAAQLMQSIENDFNHLPLETRKKFNFDVNQYIAQSVNEPENWVKNMFGEPEPIQEEIKETSSNNEQKGDE